MNRGVTAVPKPRRKKMSSSTPDTFRAAVLTVSDSCARGERNDASGPAVARTLQEHQFTIVETRIVADDYGAHRNFRARRNSGSYAFGLRPRTRWHLRKNAPRRREENAVRIIEPRHVRRFRDIAGAESSGESGGRGGIAASGSGSVAPCDPDFGGKDGALIELNPSLVVRPWSLAYRVHFFMRYLKPFHRKQD
jgi:hypothetical protein